MTAMRKVFPVTLPVESHRHVRLDLGKRMFLDEPPTGVSLGSSELIANHLSNVVRIAVLG